jgi:hypothetical protein
MSKIETTQNARVLRDEEMDLVSGGVQIDFCKTVLIRGLELENTLVSN